MHRCTGTLSLAYTHLASTVIVFALVLVTVAGCRPDASPRRIICFGDSLTAGPNIKVPEKYPERLHKLLRDNGYEYDVLNAGVPGDTTADGLRRIDSVLRDPAAILILEFGTNDAFLNVPIETMKENLAEMIRRAQAANVKVVLAGIEAPAGVAPEYNERLLVLYRELADEFQVRLIPDFMKDVRSTSGAMRKDGVHYNARGAQILAQSMFQAIEPLLAR